MMIFGLAAAPGAGDGIHDDEATRPAGEIPWARLDVFAAVWDAWVNESCGSDANGGNGRPGDFAHQWHVPPSHDHVNPGHHAGHDGYGGGHGGFDAGHGHGGPI